VSGGHGRGFFFRFSSHGFFPDVLARLGYAQERGAMIVDDAQDFFDLIIRSVAIAKILHDPVEGFVAFLDPLA
jgi:hypothetical protein